MSVDPGSATRVVLRPVGNPLPPGFAGLAAATLLVSGLQLFATSRRGRTWASWLPHGSRSG